MPTLPALPTQTYDRFDPTQNYKRWLFRAARGLQSAELNEIQDAVAQERTNFMDAEYGDGAMISGGLITLQGVSGTTANWAAAAGVFYAQGYTYQLSPTTFTVAQTGDATFPTGENCAYGIILHVDIVDETMDAGLLDNAPGTKNFGEAGSTRMRFTAFFGKQTDAGANDWFYHRIDFTNGQPTSSNNADQTPNGVLDLIAQYDRNANGNYIVRGNYVSYIGDDTDTQSHILQVSAGLSNVFGYEQQLDQAYNLEIPFALDVQQVLAEPVTFTANGTYALRNTPVATIGPQVNGIVETTQNVVHGAFHGAVDQLPNTPVVSISLITQGGTTFVQGTDYAQSGDRVTWISGGNEPSPGSTYTVTFRYSSVFTPTITDDLTGIVVTGLAPSTVFYVDYTFYVPRYDLVILDQGLAISSVKGVPSPSPVPPSATSGLLLGTVFVSFGSPPRITNSDQRRPVTSDLVTLLHAMDDIKYNVARLSLQDRLTSTDPVTEMKGLFVDPFTDDTYRDAGIAQNAEIAAGILYMGVPWTYVQLTDPSVLAYKTILPYTSAVLAEQLMHSTQFQINAFVGSSAPPATITTWPPQITWIDQTVNAVVKASPNYKPYWNIVALQKISTMGANYPGPPGSPQNVPGAVSVLSTVVTESMITTPVPVPPTTINYTGQTFNALEAVTLSFDNRNIATIHANSAGVISGSFQTPSGTLSGTKPIQFTGQTSGTVAVSSFTAVPFKQTTTKTTQQTMYYDPLSETFGPTTDAFITTVNAWITKDSAHPPGATGFVDCLLLETELGLPDRSRTIASARLYNAAIPDATGAPHTPTLFTFPEPVKISGAKQYAIVLATPNSGYFAWGCELGQYDLTYGRWISAKPTNGTLLESSNSVTWLPLLKDDLTYIVNHALFSSSSTKIYPTKTLTNVTDLMLLANVDVPNGTSVTFTATLTLAGKSVVYPISPNSPISIPLYTGPVVVKATLTTTNRDVTPSIDPQVSLAYASVINPSTYVCRAIPVPAGQSAAVSTLKVYLEIYEPDPNTVLVEYLSTDGVTWVAFTRDVQNATSLGYGVVDMPFLASSTAMVGATQTRIRVTLSSLDSVEVRRAYARNLRMYFA